MRTLDRRIDIERKTIAHDSYGQDRETWTKLANRRPARIAPVRGDERFTSSEFIARGQLEFTIRYSSVVADVSPLDRIIYPATTDTPLDHQVYDIIEVSEIGRREGVRIVAAARAETFHVE
jgi:head-tail adaptor